MQLKKTTKISCWVASSLLLTVANGYAAECEGYAWNDQVKYEKGSVVSYDGHSYRAAWLAKPGATPGENSWGPWIDEGECTPLPPALDCGEAAEWSPDMVYSDEGEQVVYDSAIYTLKWYSVGDEPDPGSGPWQWAGPCTGDPQPVGGDLECDVAWEWNGNLVYPEGTKVIKEDGSVKMLYQASWPLRHGQEPGEEDGWKLLGECTGDNKVKLSCSDEEEWAVDTDYDIGISVAFEGNIFENIAWNHTSRDDLNPYEAGGWLWKWVAACE